MEPPWPHTIGIARVIYSTNEPFYHITHSRICCEIYFPEHTRDCKCRYTYPRWLAQYRELPGAIATHKRMTLLMQVRCSNNFATACPTVLVLGVSPAVQSRFRDAYPSAFTSPIVQTFPTVCSGELYAFDVVRGWRFALGGDWLMPMKNMGPSRLASSTFTCASYWLSSTQKRARGSAA